MLFITCEISNKNSGHIKFVNTILPQNLDPANYIQRSQQRCHRQWQILI